MADTAVAFDQSPPALAEEEPEPSPSKKEVNARGHRLPRPWTDADDRRLLEGIKQGKSVDQVAREMDRSSGVAYDHAKKLGIKGVLETTGTRPGARKFTPAVEKQIASLRQKGWKTSQIAAQFKASVSTIDRVLQTTGAKTAVPYNRKEIDWKRVQKMRAQGMSMDTIGEAVGVSGATLYNRINKEGIKLVPSHAVGRPPKEKREISDAGKQAIREAQRARWRLAKQQAKLTGESPQTISVKPNRAVPLARVLGQHRKAKHGVMGMSQSTIQRRNQRLRQGSPSEIQMEESISHGHQPNHSEPNIEKDAIYLFGKFQGQLQDYADGQDIPWKILAAGVAELFALSTAQVRQRVRFPHRVPALPGSTA